jgi:hypothetical protein
MSKFNGLVNRNDIMSAGSNTDMVIAYAFRAFTIILQGVAVLALWALFNLAVNIRDDTREIKREWPELKKDVGDLKREAATKKELADAELRVKQEFTEQLKKSQVITTTQPIPGR